MKRGEPEEDLEKDKKISDVTERGKGKDGRKVNYVKAGRKEEEMG